MSRFPLFSFLLQGGQALKTVTGYGLSLGAIEGFKTDVTWAILRGNPLQKVRIQGPPPSDYLGKATRYLLQPAYHYWVGDALSFEDHYLLAAADVAATRIVQESGPLGDLPERWQVASRAPIAAVSAWHPATLQVAGEVGLRLDVENVDEAAAGFSDGSYGSVLAKLLEGFPRWIETVAGEFPQTVAAMALQAVIADGGAEVLNYLSEGEGAVTPIFDPEEISFARMWEYGVFPPGVPDGEQVTVMIERSLEIARSGGRDLPTRADLEQAILEVFGSLG